MKIKIKRRLIGNILLFFIIFCLALLTVIALRIYDPRHIFAEITSLAGAVVLVLIALGFIFPRYVGRKTAIERAADYQAWELSKWGFKGVDREGPWVNYIEGPLVVDTGFDQQLSFYSEWLVLKNGTAIVNPGESEVNLDEKTVSYDFSKRRSYAWDGCTPKVWFYWILLIGTPDWFRKKTPIRTIYFDAQADGYRLRKKEAFWQLAHRASVVHDAFYQYLDSVPVAKKEVDRLFEKMLREDDMNRVLARLYYLAVKFFGARKLVQKRLGQASPFSCVPVERLLPGGAAQP